MSKPAIFYTIRRPSFHTPGMTYAIIAVTSEGPADRLNGRYKDGSQTHCRRYNTFGRFTSEVEAIARIADIDAITKKYDAMIKPLHTKINGFYAKRDLDIHQAIEAMK